MAKEFLNSKKFIRANRIFLGISFLNAIVYLLYRIIFKEHFFSLDSYFLPLGFAIRANQVLLILTLVMFVLCIPAFYFSKLKVYITIIGGILLIPLFCIYSLFALDSFSITDQIEFMVRKYYFVHDPNIGELAGGEMLFRCDLLGRNCQLLYDGFGNSMIPIEFQINEEKRQLNIFIDWSISYIDNDELTELDHLYLGYYSHYALNAKYDPQTEKLYISKCNRQSMNQNCDLWLLELSNPEIDLEAGYFDYGVEEPESDEDWYDNYFYVENELIFYVTDEPVCVIEGCAFIEEST